MLRLTARPAVFDDQNLRYGPGQFGSEVILEHRQRQVDACTIAGRRPYRSIDNVDALCVEADLRAMGAQFVGEQPVRRDAATIEQSGIREREDAGADRGDTPSRPTGGADEGQHGRRGRHEAGELPQRQQQLQLSNVAASLPQLQARARGVIHALGVLTGDGADGLSTTLLPSAPLPALPQSLPPGLPSDLLRRRPDVRAAERQLAAANADIGVAVADLYPKFNLMGMAELISTNLATLFASNSIQTNANAAVTLPFFDGGRRKGVVAERRAAADEALIAYKKAVLVAVQDVEDALADYQAELKRNAELRRGVADAERATRLAQATFGTGLSDFQPVLDAQGSVLNARNVLSQSDAALLSDMARLYKALGGGWET